ncbi:MAG: GntR family transcriptional regulator, partial [Mycetocola sp.]
MTSGLREQRETLLTQGIGRHIADTLRRRILAGEFKPGERLSLGGIQGEFGVSVIPVREALTTLEAEGLVRTLPRRGTRVASLSLAELNDVYTLRRLIEPSLSAA